MLKSILDIPYSGLLSYGANLIIFFCFAYENIKYEKLKIVLCAVYVLRSGVMKVCTIIYCTPDHTHGLWFVICTPHEHLLVVIATTTV